jgi:hypothetical protein
MCYTFAENMIRAHTFLVAAIVLVVSCNKQNVQSTEERGGSENEPAVTIATKIHVEVQQGLVTVTDRQARLVADVKELSKGLSPQEVKQRLGNPKEESPDLFYYNLVEENINGGHFVTARLGFDDDGLASAEISYGHITRVPRTLE